MTDLTQTWGDLRVFTCGNEGSLRRSLCQRFRACSVFDGLTHLSVTALAIDPDTPARLYAGTTGGGVFVMELE